MENDSDRTSPMREAEAAINSIARDLSSVDRERDPALYDSELSRLTVKVWEYCRSFRVRRIRDALLRESIEEDLGLEVVQLVRSVLTAFKVQDGPYMNYFNAAFSRRVYDVYLEKYFSSRTGGMSVSGRTLRRYRQFERYIDEEGVDIDGCGEERYTEMAAYVGVSRGELLMFVGIKTGRIMADAREPEEYEEMMADIPDPGSAEPCPEDDGIVQMTDIVLGCDAGFARYSSRPSEQSRVTARILSECLTTFFLDVGRKAGETERVLSLISGCGFLCDEAVEDFRRTGRIPSHKDIAEKYGRSEASVSRTWGDFMDAYVYEREKGVKNGGKRNLQARGRAVRTEEIR